MYIVIQIVNIEVLWVWFGVETFQSLHLYVYLIFTNALNVKPFLGSVKMFSFSLLQNWQDSLQLAKAKLKSSWQWIRSHTGSFSPKQVSAANVCGINSAKIILNGLLSIGKKSIHQVKNSKINQLRKKGKKREKRVSDCKILFCFWIFGKYAFFALVRFYATCLSPRVEHAPARHRQNVQRCQRWLSCVLFNNDA